MGGHFAGILPEVHEISLRQRLLGDLHEADAEAKRAFVSGETVSGSLKIHCHCFVKGPFPAAAAAGSRLKLPFEPEYFRKLFCGNGIGYLVGHGENSEGERFPRPEEDFSALFVTAHAVMSVIGPDKNKRAFPVG